jgi:hypothetical protein
VIYILDTNVEARDGILILRFGKILKITLAVGCLLKEKNHPYPGSLFCQLYENLW